MSLPERRPTARHQTPLQIWISEEFEAGYQASLAGASESRTATPCWRAGWQEAQREMAVSEHPDVLSIDGEDVLPLSGREARLFGFAFRSDQAEQWKRAWIEADLQCSQGTGS